MINKNTKMRDFNKAFENAISQGMTNPNDYMYMFSTSEDGCVRDIFKHIVHRQHTSFMVKGVQHGIIKKAI
jgi:hypothetical protein